MDKKDYKGLVDLNKVVVASEEVTKAYDLKMDNSNVGYTIIIVVSMLAGLVSLLNSNIGVFFWVISLIVTVISMFKICTGGTIVQNLPYYKELCNKDKIGYTPNYWAFVDSIEDYYKQFDYIDWETIEKYNRPIDSEYEEPNRKNTNLLLNREEVGEHNQKATVSLINLLDKALKIMVANKHINGMDALFVKATELKDNLEVGVPYLETSLTDVGRFERGLEPFESACTLLKIDENNEKVTESLYSTMGVLAVNLTEIEDNILTPYYAEEIKELQINMTEYVKAIGELSEAKGERLYVK